MKRSTMSLPATSRLVTKAETEVLEAKRERARRAMIFDSIFNNRFKRK